jgi:hypothetical protein
MEGKIGQILLKVSISCAKIEAESLKDFVQFRKSTKE